MKACFVILHYITINDTINCVKSIHDTVDYDDYSIVIVDNGSPNQTGAELEKLYKDTPDVHVILQKENLGFAKGNNIGYAYAKHEEHADLMIVINSDTIIKDRDFIHKIIKSHENNHFSVLGPDIITPFDEHQNPFRNRMLTKKQVKNRIRNKTIFWWYYNLKKKIKLFRKINLLENLFEKKSKNQRSGIDSAVLQEGIVLQGAAVIYAADYIRNEDSAFLPDTFMYGEEDLLACRCAKKHYKMVYDPSIRILHLYGGSTKKACKNTLDKNLFFTKYTLEGSKILLKKMNETR